MAFYQPARAVSGPAYGSGFKWFASAVTLGAPGLKP